MKYTTGKAARAAGARRFAREQNALLRVHKSQLKYYLDAEAGDEPAYFFLLQRMPVDPNNSETTTCRHPFCPGPQHVSQPGTYRVSIEPKDNFNPRSRYSTHIPLTPLHVWSNKLKFGPYARTKRGLGRNVEAWWCLPCLEEVWLEGKGFIKQPFDHTRLDRPDVDDLSMIYPEERSGGVNGGLYHLPSPHRYGLEKWRATIQHEQSLNGVTMGPNAVGGQDRGTLYEDEAVRDLRGIDEETGEAVEVTACQVRGKRLSEVFRLVDESVALKRREYHQAMEESREVASGETTPGEDEDVVAGPSRSRPVEPNSTGPPAQQRLRLTVKRRGNEGPADDASAAAPPTKHQRLILKPPNKDHPSNQA